MKLKALPGSRRLLSVRASANSSKASLNRRRVDSLELIWLEGFGAIGFYGGLMVQELVLNLLEYKDSTSKGPRNDPKSKRRDVRCLGLIIPSRNTQ